VAADGLTKMNLFDRFKRFTCLLLGPTYRTRAEGTFAQMRSKDLSSNHTLDDLTFSSSYKTYSILSYRVRQECHF
jgi:hypothetical protein